MNRTGSVSRAAPNGVERAIGKVSGRRAGDAPRMQMNHTRLIQRGVDREELDRHIAEMYRDVANEVERDLHFTIGRPLADELGYPAALLDRMSDFAVRGSRSCPSALARLRS
jgi:hypothetical protein